MPSYMANIRALTSPQGRMTHLSWDEGGPCVLGMAAPMQRDRDKLRLLGMGMGMEIKE
jgi:hypothetical protein